MDEVMFTEKHEKKLDAVYESVIRIEATLNNGIKKQLAEVCESHYKLKRNTYFIVGVLVGSGAITGGYIGISNLLGG